MEATIITTAPAILHTAAHMSNVHALGTATWNDEALAIIAPDSNDDLPYKPKKHGRYHLAQPLADIADYNQYLSAFETFDQNPSRNLVATKIEGMVTNETGPVRGPLDKELTQLADAIRNRKKTKWTILLRIDTNGTNVPVYFIEVLRSK